MNWINGFGLAIVVLMLIPNLVYAFRNKDIKNKCTSRFFNGLEQVGRYGSMFLMVFNIGIFEFGFRSENEFAVWLVSSLLLLIAYWGIWVFYCKTPCLLFALLLAVIPSVLFVLNGLLLRHWLLVVFGLAFACGHIFITYQNNRAE